MPEEKRPSPGKSGSFFPPLVGDVFPAAATRWTSADSHSGAQKCPISL